MEWSVDYELNGLERNATHPIARDNWCFFKTTGLQLTLEQLVD